jgi:hypothetical protein
MSESIGKKADKTAAKSAITKTLNFCTNLNNCTFLRICQMILFNVKPF